MLTHGQTNIAISRAMLLAWLKTSYSTVPVHGWILNKSNNILRGNICVKFVTHKVEKSSFRSACPCHQCHSSVDFFLLKFTIFIHSFILF